VDVTLTTYKKQGETPLEALERLRAEKGIPKDVPMTYAGRLDPMAEGLLIILVGEECKKKDQYLGLDKEYEVEVLLGVSSDTGDILGKLQVVGDKLQVKKAQTVEIKSVLDSLVGKRKEKYPAFSSKPLNGKPLFAHARAGIFDDPEENNSIEMPEKEIEIYSIELLDLREEAKDRLVKEAIERIEKVKGDFRQSGIIGSWKDFERENAQGAFQIVKIYVACSSGAYMRTLAEKIGEKLGLSALAWSIKRTKIQDLRVRA
jgi:tRNA pseudouridine(55) synthase